MPVNPAAGSNLPQSTATAAVARLGLELTSLPLGTLLAATVSKVTGSVVSVNVDGTAVPLRGATGLAAGAVVLAKVAAGGRTLEFVGQVLLPRTGGVPSKGPTTTAIVAQVIDGKAVLTLPSGTIADGPSAPNANRTTTAAERSLPELTVSIPANGLKAEDRVAIQFAEPPSVAPKPATVPRAVAVEVLSRNADGTYQVAIDGRARTAVAAEPLTAGATYIRRVTTPPTGPVTLEPIPEGPQKPIEIATAILRAAPRPADLGKTLPTLAQLSDPVAAPVREALKSILPPTGSPPGVSHLKALVADGGLGYEAKLARGETPAIGTDFKGAILQMLGDLRSTTKEPSAAAPIAQTALDGIESVQAVNVLAQGTAFVLQVPFPDGAEWQTLHLSITPDEPSQSDGRPSGFHVLMQVELSALGETWIDAGLTSDRVRAVLYASTPASQERLRAELPALQGALMADGFRQVLLDVRGTADLPARVRTLATTTRAGGSDNLHLVDAKA